jgi:hypothetical protein
VRQHHIWCYITGVSTVLLEADDPFPRGYRIGALPREPSQSGDRASKRADGVGFL